MALNDISRFLRTAILHPRKTGAIAPSSAALARAMAAQIDPAAPGNILELGPGTGVVTQALIARGIAPERITAVEYDRDFAALVEKRFPGVQVVCGDAFDLDRTLGPAAKNFAGVVSSLPLLNYAPEQRRAVVEGALSRLKPGAPYVHFTYGVSPSVPATARYSATRMAVIWINLPPARVWVYRNK
jgi:phosphatidylethanolamine/phosphatidyl-N-methylethanolamine N-methyltransferase